MCLCNRHLKPYSSSITSYMVNPGNPFTLSHSILSHTFEMIRSFEHKLKYKKFLLNVKLPSLFQGWLNTGTVSPEKVESLSIHEDIQNPVGYSSRTISSSGPCSVHMIFRGTILQLCGLAPLLVFSFTASDTPTLYLWRIALTSYVLTARSTSLPACDIRTGFPRVRSPWGAIALGIILFTLISAPTFGLCNAGS